MRRLLLVLAAALAGAASLAEGAYASVVPGVYWSSGTSIGRANLNGTGVNQGFIGGTSNAQGITADGQHLYWANSGAGTIGRANLDGTAVDQGFIAGAKGPEGIATDAGHIYWTNLSGQGIGRASLNGGAVNQTFVSALSAPWGLTVDRQHVYFAESTNLGQTIGRTDLEGTGVNRFFIVSPVPGAYWVAVDLRHIYWTINSGSTATIARANLDGTGINTNFITGLGTDLTGLTVAGPHIYWANYSPGSAKIGRANLDGSGVNRSFISGLAEAYDVAVTGDGAPTATPSPSALSFGNQPLYRFSPHQSLTVMNTGSVTLQISRVQVSSGDVDDFLISGDTCSGNVLGPGDRCDVQVRFGPYQTGRRSATLTFASNDPQSPLEIALSGTGVKTLVGARGNPAVVRCKTVTQTRLGHSGHPRPRLRVKVAKCSGNVSAAVGSFSSAQATIVRGGLVYARGRDAHARRSHLGAVLRELRPLRRGRYTLVLRRRSRHRWIVRRVPLSVV
jgi:virginiamycin B lyase